MLDLFNNIKREIVLLKTGTFSGGEIENIDLRFKGMDLLIKLSNELFTSKFNSRCIINDKTVIESLCNDFYNFYRNTFEHYFHILYRLIKFVDNSNIKDKEFYSDIVCVSLSDAEVNLLFYYCYFLDKAENKELVKLVEKYELLKYFTDPKKHCKFIKYEH